MRTAFVLSGGGSLGAVQVGMLQSLHEVGIQPDLLVGTSAGALNAAFVAGHGWSRGALTSLARAWVSTRRKDIFPALRSHPFRAILGTSAALFPSAPLERLVASRLPFDFLQDTRIELHVVATDVLSGREVLLSQGDAVSAVTASSAIPGILPPVERDGLLLVDGGLADHAAVSQALRLGAERVVVLPAGYSCALDRPPRGALGMSLHALSLLIEQRLILEVDRFAQESELVVLPPLCPLAISSADFSQAASLIARSRTATARWLAEGGPMRPRPARFLSMHGHATAPGHERSTRSQERPRDLAKDAQVALVTRARAPLPYSEPEAAPR